jgi:ABC-type Fe3+-hydroxamate transport system substrate-binding protein
MISLVDQAGNRVTLDRPAQRIVSLVPSQTELLYYFGLETETIGITKFCIHPDEWFRSKQRVGGTKNLALDLIKELKPDLEYKGRDRSPSKRLSGLYLRCKYYS